jgi:hypothetical protein
MSTYIQYGIAVIGVVSIIYSVFSYIRIRRFLSRCTETRGEVIRLERTRSSGEFASYDYAPVFQFQTSGGESVTVTSNMSSSPAGFDVGQRVLVRYDPANPSDAKIHTLFQTWGGFALPLAIGVFFLFVVGEQAHWLPF